MMQPPATEGSIVPRHAAVGRFNSYYAEARHAQTALRRGTSQCVTVCRIAAWQVTLGRGGPRTGEVCRNRPLQAAVQSDRP